MKKVLTYISALYALLSCSSNLSVERESISLTVEAPSSNKVQILGMSTVWNAGDSVSVFHFGTRNLPWAYVGEDLSSSGSICYRGPLPEHSTDRILAVYPYRRGNCIAGRSIMTEIPSVQVFEASSYDRKSVLMVSEGNGSSLSFSYATAFMALNLKGPESVISSIVMESVSGENIAGTVAIDMDAVPACTIVGEGLSSIRLEGKDGNPIGFDGDETFFFSIPPGDYTGGFRFTVNMAGGASFEVYDDMPETLLPGHVRTLEYDADSSDGSVFEMYLPFLVDSHGFSPFKEVTAIEGSAKTVSARSFTPAEYPSYRIDMTASRIRMIWGKNNGWEYTASVGDYIRIPKVSGYSLFEVAVRRNSSKTLDFIVTDDADGADELTCTWECADSGLGLYCVNFSDGRVLDEAPYRLVTKTAGTYMFAEIVFRYKKHKK